MTSPTGAPDLKALDIEGLRRLALAASPGPWTVWVENCPDRLAAASELSMQVRDTEPFVGKLYMLSDAKGKCPALTGCGPRSEANAAFLTAFDPPSILALLTRIESDAAEIARLREALASSSRHSDGERSR